MLKGVENPHQYEELIKVFMPKGMYEIYSGDGGFRHGDQEIPGVSGVSDAAGCAGCGSGAAPGVQGPSGMPEDCRVFSFNGDREALKRKMYRSLELYTGKSPKWGVLTGIRPVKLAGEILDSCGSMIELERILKEKYLLHQDKADLVTDILQYQRQTAGRPEPGSLGMYIGIPFCPTRCLYCSFTSNQVPEPEIDRYLQALYSEIEYCAAKIKEKHIPLESIYIGGGTPTTLNESQLEELLSRITDLFDTGNLSEFTVEAGRPDTFTEDKLRIIRAAGAGRISINPQTMKEETLQLIGRRHTVSQTEQAFEMARRVGIDCINADLIAGLPGESFEDFCSSLQRIADTGAENITLHTLAVKRASVLKELDEEYNYKNEELCTAMLDHALKYLRERGYRPYYLYRQKHTSGNTENLGFCRDDKVSVYNIRIMEEAQSILALGAGGMSKVYFPEENRLERVANVSNYQIYIDRIGEMIERKEKNFWR